MKYCKTCNLPSGVTDLCDFCWEVEHRLEAYLKSQPAPRRIRSLQQPKELNCLPSRDDALAPKPPEGA